MLFEKLMGPPRILTVETSSLCLFDVDSTNVQDPWCGDGGADGLDSFGTASSVLVRSRRVGDYNSLLRRVGEISGTRTDLYHRFLNPFCTSSNAL